MTLPYRRCSLCKHGSIYQNKCIAGLDYTKDDYTKCGSFVHWSDGQREPNQVYNPLLNFGVILGEKCKSGGIGKLA